MSQEPFKVGDVVEPEDYARQYPGFRGGVIEQVGTWSKFGGQIIRLHGQWANAPHFRLAPPKPKYRLVSSEVGAWALTPDGAYTFYAIFHRAIADPPEREARVREFMESLGYEEETK